LGGGGYPSHLLPLRILPPFPSLPCFPFLPLLFPPPPSPPGFIISPLSFFSSLPFSSPFFSSSFASSCLLSFFPSFPLFFISPSPTLPLPFLRFLGVPLFLLCGLNSFPFFFFLSLFFPCLGFTCLAGGGVGLIPGSVCVHYFLLPNFLTPVPLYGLDWDFWQSYSFDSSPFCSIFSLLSLSFYL